MNRTLRHGAAVFLALTAAAAAAGPCTPPGGAGSAVVRHVIDGDTVVLDDGTHLRLVGVDTPELGRDGRAPAPGADEAREFLAGLLPPGTAVGLVAAPRPRDHYGRLLGHLFLAGGDNIQARLLAAGLAVPLTIPPNLGFLDCYREAAAHAMAAGAGLWRLPDYRPVAAAALPQDARGYRVVHGRIARRGDSRSSVWLEFAGGPAIRIVREDLAYFGDFDPGNLPGTWLEARGMVYKRNGQLRMRIRHPVDLRLLPADAGTPAE